MRKFFSCLLLLSFTVYRSVSLRKTTGCPVIGGENVARNFTANGKGEKFMIACDLRENYQKSARTWRWNWLLLLSFHSFTRSWIANCVYNQETFSSSSSLWEYASNYGVWVKDATFGMKKEKVSQNDQVRTSHKSGCDWESTPAPLNNK